MFVFEWYSLFYCTLFVVYAVLALHCGESAVQHSAGGRAPGRCGAVAVGGPAVTDTRSMSAITTRLQHNNNSILPVLGASFYRCTNELLEIFSAPITTLLSLNIRPLIDCYLFAAISTEISDREQRLWLDIVECFSYIFQTQKTFILLSMHYFYKCIYVA